MAMSRIIKTLAPRRPSILTFPRLFSAGSDVDKFEYMVCLRLPEEKLSCSKEERDDWFHSYLSSSLSCSGSNAEAAAAPSSPHRDPRILDTCPDGFSAKLSVEDIYALMATDEFLCANPRGKIDYTKPKGTANDSDKTHENPTFHGSWR